MINCFRPLFILAPILLIAETVNAQTSPEIKTQIINGSVNTLTNTESVNTQSKFIPIPGDNKNLYVDKDILNQEQLNPDMRIGKIVTMNQKGELSNVSLTLVNCKTNSSGVLQVLNGQGQIVYLETNALKLTNQLPNSQAYNAIKIICELPKTASER